jgi:zinc transporter ZupT
MLNPEGRDYNSHLENWLQDSNKLYNLKLYTTIFLKKGRCCHPGAFKIVAMCLAIPSKPHPHPFSRGVAKIKKKISAKRERDMSDNFKCTLKFA